MLAPKNQLRCLTYPPDLAGELPLYVASNSLPIQAAGFEPAGLAFHAAALRLLGLDKSDGDSEEDVVSDKKEKTSSPSVDSYQSKGKKKSGSAGDQQDHYALLGLAHLRFLATEEQIRKAYRETALKHHPDKQAALLLTEETEEGKEAKKEEIDKHFKSIQEAYEVLIDPTKRRVYDSIDEFDDEIPDDCAPEDFFKVYSPVFMRNGRWSTIQPVPNLGDDNLSMQEVDAFYDFWWGFKSWREFPHADEFDLEQAENREHKRWMERQNGKLREKAKKEENSRIRVMVENAYRKDPRVARRKEQEKAEKLRKKQAKDQARREKEEEAARVVEEEKKRKEEEEKKAAEEAAALKKIREKEKKLVRKERARLRAAAAGLVGRKDLGVFDDTIEDLCMSLEITQLRQLCERLEGSNNVAEQAHILLGKGTVFENGGTVHVESARDSSAAGDVKQVPATSPAPKVEKKASSVANAVKKERPWSKEELDLLRKAVSKYPKGTSQRWEVVSTYLGTGRSAEEITRAVKTRLQQKPDSSKAFDSFLFNRKTASVTIDSPLSTRDDGVKETSPNVVPVKGSETTRGGNAKKDVKVVENGVPKSAANGNSSVEVSEKGNNGVANPDGWSDAQTHALVVAAKSFPKDTDRRWEKIAAEVPGMSRAQCMKKYTELRDKYKKATA